MLTAGHALPVVWHPPSERPMKAPGASISWPNRYARTCNASQKLLDDGTLRVPIQNGYELTNAGEALAAFGSTHTQDKLSIWIS